MSVGIRNVYIGIQHVYMVSSLQLRPALLQSIRAKRGFGVSVVDGSFAPARVARALAGSGGPLRRGIRALVQALPRAVALVAAPLPSVAVANDASQLAHHAYRLNGSSTRRARARFGCRWALLRGRGWGDARLR